MMLIVAVALLCGSAPQRQAEADHAAIAQAALTEVIRPGYAALAGAADALQGKMDALCRQPSEPALDQAKQAFAATVAAWSKVEILRFGPVTEDHRYRAPVLLAGPQGHRPEADAGGTRRARRERVTLPDELAGKSVALQGLPALEYLLYGDGAETLAKERQIVGGEESPPEVDTEGAFRCGFALAVATNIDRIAAPVVEGLARGLGLREGLSQPRSPKIPIYHAPKEVTLDLFKAFTSGIELVRDQKLGKPLGASPEEAKPKLAAFWRSGLTFANAAGNLEGVRALFAQGGFAQVVAGESAGVENSILFDLDHAIEVLRGIDQPMAEVVGGRGSARQDRGLARRAEERRADRRRHDLARRRPRLRLQRHGWRLAMEPRPPHAAGQPRLELPPCWLCREARRPPSSRMLRRRAPGRPGQFLGGVVYPRRRCAGRRAAAARPRHHAQAGRQRMGRLRAPSRPVRRRHPARCAPAGLVRLQARSAFLRPRRVLGRRQAALHHRERL